ncbi:IS21 family transposase [Olsenella sp. Marseille-P4559]|uniref:IS21 family transposase n=1 Tax=Olsenella sp. Marseille-P4559 TaxID=2364795 RepID=UPI0013EF1C16|nr:IS21 family transposase [Olsenella sp. Marseille-P4559]
MPLSTRQAIRELDAGGTSRAQIARDLHVSRNTVRKYADMEDMSPAAPVSARPHPAIDADAAWVDSVLEADLGAPRKQRHTARRIYDRLVEERGYRGSYSAVCRHVGEWRRAHARSPREGCLELAWEPGTAQVDYGAFRAVVAGAPRTLRLLVVTLPHPSARFCVAMGLEGSECLCWGLRLVFEWVGRAPRVLVPDDATEAGRMLRGVVTESELFSHFRAHYRLESRCRDPCPGNERGPVENAVGPLRRNLPVPVPEVASIDELNERLRAGCERINAGARSRAGAPTPEALREDLAGMLALPGTPFDAAGWAHARADKRGYVRVDGNPCCVGPAWHDRELVVGVRARSVEVLADRGRRVATLARSFGEGETVRNPASLIPALVARPRAFGESTIRLDMPAALVGDIDRCDKAGRRRALRAIGRASEHSGFGAACEAAARIFGGGRVPDDASCDALARRVAAGGPEPGRADLAVYDGFLGEAARDAE